MSVYDLIAPKQCPRRHSIKTYAANPAGEWVRGDDEAFGLLIQGNGTVKYRLRCNHCGHRSSDIPRAQVTAWGLLNVEWVEAKEPTQYPPCSVESCPEQGREWHHFAPRNTFGDTADNWPVLPLCTSHHREWHTRMDGYRWHRRAAA